VVIFPYRKNEKKFQIIDISEGGCGFVYTGRKEDLIEAGKLSFTERENIEDGELYEVDDVRFESANDIELDEAARRRGFKLLWLGELDKKGFLNSCRASSCAKSKVSDLFSVYFPPVADSKDKHIIVQDREDHPIITNT
jgi:c-di-GMP-binding flagellar brake protein YcgR